MSREAFGVRPGLPALSDVANGNKKSGSKLHRIPNDNADFANPFRF